MPGLPQRLRGDLFLFSPPFRSTEKLPRRCSALGCEGDPQKQRSTDGATSGALYEGGCSGSDRGRAKEGAGDHHSVHGLVRIDLCRLAYLVSKGKTTSTGVSSFSSLTPVCRFRGRFHLVDAVRLENSRFFLRSRKKLRRQSQQDSLDF